MAFIINLLPENFQTPLARACIIILITSLFAFAIRMVFNRLFLTFTAKTKTDLDDRLTQEIRGPLVYTILFVGIGLSIVELRMGTTTNFISLGCVKTIIVIVLSRAAMRIGNILLEIISSQTDRIPWIQPKTMPLFDIVLRVLVIGGSIYFAFIAWDINVTSWVASAGIVGIAVGFAAKDTLANLFAGVFILADAPYKIGDYVLLDNGIRGAITNIGIRSTRLLTRDDIEITVPNAIIANSTIVNETSGRYPKMRVRLKVSVAYGSDIDRVRAVLLSCVSGVQHVSAMPKPRVRFRTFGDSGLNFELLVWVEEPAYRGRVLDALNTLVYKAFNASDIEIPYNKYDVYIKENSP